MCIMNEKSITKVKNKEVASTIETGGILSVIERAATDPNVDIDKMERLLAMHERLMEKQALTAYNEAFSLMQDQLPTIREGGKIEFNGKIVSEYARWDEDVNPVIKPILKNNGFSLSFKLSTKEGVKVKAILSHNAGHSEETEIFLPADTSGSKNAVQAVASSVSYGKRYTAGSLLNLSTCGQDNDGNLPIERISEEQERKVWELIKKTETNANSLCTYYKVKQVKDLPAQVYDDVILNLNTRLDKLNKDKK